MARPTKFKKTFYSWESVPIILNVKECCEILRCSAPTVQNYIRLGELKAAKHGNKYFVSKENLMEFMNMKFKAETGGLPA